MPRPHPYRYVIQIPNHNLLDPTLRFSQNQKRCEPVVQNLVELLELDPEKADIIFMTDRSAGGSFIVFDYDNPEHKRCEARRYIVDDDDPGGFREIPVATSRVHYEMEVYEKYPVIVWSNESRFKNWDAREERWAKLEKDKADKRSDEALKDALGVDGAMQARVAARVAANKAARMEAAANKERDGSPEIKVVEEDSPVKIKKEDSPFKIKEEPEEEDSGSEGFAPWPQVYRYHSDEEWRDGEWRD